MAVCCCTTSTSWQRTNVSRGRCSYGKHALLSHSTRRAACDGRERCCTSNHSFSTARLAPITPAASGSSCMHDIYPTAPYNGEPTAVRSEDASEGLLAAADPPHQQCQHHLLTLLMPGSRQMSNSLTQPNTLHARPIGPASRLYPACVSVCSLFPPMSVSCSVAVA